ncbi:MAG: hypothetical protein WHX52_08340 [Anaerolineae bacterium]
MKAARVGRLLLALAGACLALTCVWLAQRPATSYAQQGGIYVDKQLGRASNVIYIGEYITFTIYIRNDSAFTVTVLPLADQYNQAVLAYADASIAPDTVDPANGRIDWNDLTESVGDLPPGQAIVVVVGFIAEHPSPSVVNAAQVHDAINSNGDVVGGDDSSDENESVGGSAPVTKTLMEQAGVLVTFTIEVWNHSYATMTMAVLEDTYDPTALAFFSADPPPDEWDFNTGWLRWPDLTLHTGDIPPFGVVTVTTVFTTIGNIGAATANQAGIVAAGDWYGNDVTGGADKVPIVIIDRPGGPTPPPPTSPPPTAPPQPPQQPQPTPTLEIFTVTPTPVLVLLPETGDAAVLGRFLLFGTLALLLVGCAFVRRKSI